MKNNVDVPSRRGSIKGTNEADSTKSQAAGSKKDKNKLKQRKLTLS